MGKGKHTNIQTGPANRDRSLGVYQGNTRGVSGIRAKCVYQGNTRGAQGIRWGISSAKLIGVYQGDRGIPGVYQGFEPKGCIRGKPGVYQGYVFSSDDRSSG